ncbi:MAG: hypothetical protein U0836_06770 [Pirellulales bacterium]
MADRPVNPGLSTLAALLARLRAAIRRYVLVQGLARAVVWLGLMFWLSLAVDWFFEPPVGLRAAVLAIAGLGLAAVLYRDVLRRLIAPLADTSLALVLERRFPQLGGSLATAVELEPSEEKASELTRRMLAHSLHQAVERSSGLPLAEVFDRRPLVRAVAGAGLLALSIVALAIVSTPSLQVWYARNVRLAEVRWPRKTSLSVAGFKDGRVRIARGSDFDLMVQADARKTLPRVVQVRYVTEEGARGRDNLSQVGQASAGDAAQTYVHTFKGVLVSIDLDIRGGDDRLSGLRIEVVDSPTAAVTLDVAYPAYTQRAAARGLPASSLMTFPQGSTITLHGLANKPLEAVEIARGASGSEAPQPPALAKVSERTFDWTLPPLDKDETLLVTLHDTDGLRNRQPLRLSFTALPDEAPQVLAQLQGIGTAITPQARIPFTGQVTDDYGLSKAWFEHQVGESESVERPLELGPEGKLDGLSFSAAELQLSPGQQLLLGLKVADNRALAGGANIGSSQRYLLEVVTPEELRAIVEARELVLRRRLETIIEEFTDTRDSLDRVELPTPSAAPAAARRRTGGDGFVAQVEAPNAEPAPNAPAGEKSAAESVPPPATEPPVATPPAETQAEAQERRRQVSALRVQRALQNSLRAAHEVTTLATSFDDIRAELANNGLDSETLQTRLKGGIADPLRAIAAEQFPRFDERLTELEKHLEDPTVGPSALLASRQQADVILIQMKQVLDKMIEMESFTEVLDMLRSIIADQEALQDRTKQQRDQDALDLLEEDE